MNAKRTTVWIALVGLMLLSVAGCNKPEKRSSYNQGPNYAKVSVAVPSPQLRSYLAPGVQAAISTLPLDTQGSMIVAVPASEPFNGDYAALSSTYDANLLDLTTGEVSLLLPLETPMHLFEYTFAKPVAFVDEIFAGHPSAVAGADLGLVTLTAGTTLVQLTSRLTPITRPASVAITSVALSINTPVQLSAVATYADGSSQDLTNLATWTLADPSLGSITDGGPSKGQVTGVVPGKLVVNANVLGVIGTVTLTVSGSATNDGFAQLISQGSYTFESNEDLGVVDYYQRKTLWGGNVGETFDLIDPVSQSLIPSVSPNQRYLLENGVWVPDVMALTITNVDYAANTIDFVNPVGRLTLDSTTSLGNTNEGVDTWSQNLLNVAMVDSNSLAYNMSFQIDFGAERYFIERLVITYDGTNQTFTDFPTFLSYFSDPYNNFEQRDNTHGLYFDYTPGQLSGTVSEAVYDNTYTLLSTSVAGTWSLTTIQGQSMLIANITATGYQKGGTPGATIWAAGPTGELYQGQTEPAVQSGQFKEYNQAAAAEVVATILGSPSSLFISSNYNPGVSVGTVPGTGTVGGPPPVPQALNFDGATKVLQNSVPSTMTVANLFTVGAWFSVNDNLTKQPILQITEGTGNNEIEIYLEASTGVLGVILTDSVTGASIQTHVTSTNPVSLGQRHLVLAGFDGTTLTVQIDGIGITPIVVLNNGPALSDTSRTIKIGAGSGPSQLSGQVHSVMIWNVLLPAGAVSELYSQSVFWDMAVDVGQYTQSLNLVHWWKFDRTPNVISTDYGYATALIPLDGGTSTSADFSNFYWMEPAKMSPNGVTSPAGGELLNSGIQEVVAWNPASFAGTLIDVYVLGDPTSGYLLSPSATNLPELVASLPWQQLSGGLSNLGSTTINLPTYLNGSGFRFLLVDDLGNWDLTDGEFSINQGFGYFTPRALDLSGTAGLGSVTPVTLGVANTFTAGVWYTNHLNTGKQTLLAAHDGTTNNSIELFLDATGIPSILLQAGATITHYTAPAALPTYQGHFLAATYDGAAMSLYVDGSPVTLTAGASHTGLAALTDTARVVEVGYSQNASFFSGNIVSTALWSTVLTAAEIADLHRHNQGWGNRLDTLTWPVYVSYTSLQHWWQFDQGAAGLVGPYTADMGFSANPIDIGSGGVNNFNLQMLSYSPYSSAQFVNPGLSYPVGGETITGGVGANITWGPSSFISSTNVDVYLIDDLNKPPMGITDPDLFMQIVGVQKKYIGTAVGTSGTLAFDPAVYGVGAGSHYRILAVGDAGEWDLSATDFFIN